MPLQIRRGTEADRAAQTVAFAAGELVYTTDSQKLYVGDGTTVGGIILSGFNAVNAKTAAAAMFTGGTSSGITYSYDSNAQVMNSTVSFPSTLSGNLGLNGNSITGTGNINITGTVTATSFSGSIGGNLGSDVVLNSHNITGTGSISISGNVTATTFYGNINGGLAADLAMNSHNISGSGNLSTTGNVSANTISGNFSGSLGSNLSLNSHDITGTGNIYNTGNINNTGNISVTGTISATNGLGTDLLLNNHNITGTGNVSITGTISASGGLGARISLNNYGINGTGDIRIVGPVVTQGSPITVQQANPSGTIPGAPAFILQSSRGSIASPTVISNGDAIGRLSFQAWNGTLYDTVAAVAVGIDTTSPNLNDPGLLSFSVNSYYGSGNYQRAYFNSLGVLSTPAVQISGVTDTVKALLTTYTNPNSTFTGHLIWDTTTFALQFYDGNVWSNVLIGSTPIATPAAAATIASSSTITPTAQITFVSGTAAVSIITPPNGFSSGGGHLTLIPTGAFTTTTTGNIALASTAVVGKALIMTYDSGTSKWYPSY